MEQIFNTLKDRLTDEVKKIARKNDMTPADLEIAKEAVCLIDKIEEMDTRKSTDAMMSAGVYYPHMQSGANMRSPVTGRYISGTVDYDHRMSGHSFRDRMIARLEPMYDEAQSEHERKMLSEWITRIQNQAQ